jgi:hypothetical protein
MSGLSEISRRAFAACSAANASPVPKRVPSRAGIDVSRISAAAIAADVRTLHNSRAGRSSRRKKSLVITLAGSGTASSGGV